MQDKQTVWRLHLRKIFEEIHRNWIPEGLDGLGLITDLYDEANYAAQVLKSFRSKRTSWVGIDKSHQIVRDVHKQKSNGHLANLDVLVSDIRHCPFQNSRFDFVISHSTLDHFKNGQDLLKALGEIHRILRPGGKLLITLDNPCNPILCRSADCSF